MEVCSVRELVSRPHRSVTSRGKQPRVVTTPAHYAGPVSFRTVNRIVGAVLAAQAVAVIVLLSSVTPALLPVTAEIGGGIPIASVNLGVAAVVLLVFAAVWRAVKPGSVARWVEWSQVSGVVVFLLAQLSGITDVAALVALYALAAGSVLFLVLHERGPSDAGRWSFSFGAAVAVVPWGIIAFYQIGGLVVGSDPGAATRILTVVLLLIASAYWYDTRLARVKDKPHIAEITHLVFVSATVTLLAWTSLLIAAA